MKRTIAAAGLLVTLVAASAHAQSADHSSCAPWKAKWEEVSGADLAAIDDVIGKIPATCPNLKADAAKGRGEAVQRAEQARAAAAQQQAALEAARRANDPCQAARNDWSYVQNGSEGTLQSYISGLPAACATWKSQAQERLDGLVSQRVAKEQEAERQRTAAAQKVQQEAQRIEDITAAAKATGIEGRWGWPNECGNLDHFVSVENAEVIVRMQINSRGGLSNPGRFKITQVEPNNGIVRIAPVPSADFNTGMFQVTLRDSLGGRIVDTLRMTSGINLYQRC